MTKLKLADLLAALQELSPKDRDTLRLHIDALQSVHRGKVGRVPSEEGFYSVLAELLSSNGIRAAPFPMFARQPGYPAYRTALHILDIYITDNIKPRTLTERRKAHLILIRIVIRYLRDVGAPLSARSIVQCLDQIPTLVDQTFPGYLQAGLLPIILKAHRVG